MLRRFLDRRRIFAPDRRHFHHMLIDMGIKQRHVVVAIYLMTLLFAGLGMFMMITHDKHSIVIFACIIILMLLLFNVVGSVRLRETISGLQKKYEIANMRKQEQIKFEDAQLHFRNAHTFDQWWTAACKAAERLDFAWLSLKSEGEDGTDLTEIWRRSDSKPELSRLVIMTIPLKNNGDKSPLEFEMAISVNGSLESAGHRATLFNRLLDEYSIIYN
jgi:UDP-GlcNAc:undecaprenyl-phosphate GlcNAc-1-phosphate transferase